MLASTVCVAPSFAASVELAGVEVDADHRGRAGEARAGDRGDADAAAAEHRDAVAVADLARQHRGAEPGHHAAAEQPGGLGPRLRVDLRALTGSHQRLVGERADAERGRQLGSVLQRHLLRGVERGEAVVRLALAARPARAAHGAPVEDHVVAGRDARDVGPDRFDGAGGLVAEQERKVVVDAALAVVEVGVAHPARLHVDHRFARPGVGHDDRLDADGLALRHCDDAADFVWHSDSNLVVRIILN